MGWFRRKANTTPPSKKGASFLLSLGAARAGLSGASFNQYAAEGYIENVIAFQCINRLADAVSSVEWHLYKKGKGGKLDKIEDHPLLSLIQSPNPAQSGQEFRQELVSYHRLAGTAYVYGNGTNEKSKKPPLELQVLNPGRLKVIPGSALFPQAYEYRPNPNQTITYPVDQITGKSAILKLKTFNPLNPMEGLSPLAAAALGVDIHNDGQKWNKRLIENGARPSGALVVKDAEGKAASLSDDQYTRLKEMIDDQFSGAGNAGRPMLLEGGLEWQEMSLNPKDMEFLQGKNSAARDIALAFGVPPQLLGIPGDNTYSNYAEAQLAFWTGTAIPLLCSILEGFNRWLTPLYGDDLFLWYDPDSIDALEPLRKSKADRIENSKSMTVNEKRRAMGLDDLPNGIGDVLVLDGRGILLGMDGSIVALGINQSVDPLQDPLINPNAVPPVDPNAAKHRAWLLKEGFTEERADRLTKLVYG